MIMERLDRGVCSSDWKKVFPIFVIKHLEFWGSDHRPLVLEASEHHSLVDRCWKKRARFYFEECWANEQDCADIVNSSWKDSVDSCNVESVLRNIKHCGQKLFLWNNRKIRVLQHDIIKRKYALREASLNLRPNYWKVINGLEGQLDEALNLKERYWRARNKINGIFDDEGIWWDSNVDMARVFTVYFIKLFQSSGPPTVDLESVLGDTQRRLPSVMSRMLDVAFSGEEKFWDKIGVNVVKACLDVLNEGALMEGMNKTIITQIPKVHHPSTPSEFRPISLCNVLYKIIAKTIANRFRRVLDGVVSENQSAFIPGLRITDNSIVGFECLHILKCRKRKYGSMAIKLYMSKVYDRVEWCFLQKMLIKCGFFEKWVCLIMNMIFSKADVSNCQEVRTVLDTYAKFSGQLVNYNKSAVFVSPSFSVGWGEKLLSVGGKDILIKAVIQAIPAYAMNLFRLPKSLNLEINRLCTRFWWGSCDNDKKIQLCKWSRLYRHKMDGGLGFRDLDTFNRALLANQCWRILKNLGSLAANVLKGCYFKNSSFLESRTKPSASFIWRSLCWGKEVLEKGLRWRVEDGTLVQIYTDKWIPRQYTFKILSQPHLEIDATVDQIISPSGGWNNTLIKQSFNQDDVVAIQSIPIGSSRCGDSLVWHYANNGAFNVKSGYWVARSMVVQASSSNSASSISTDWWKKLWNLKIPQKIKIFIWNGCFDWIPTMYNLCLRRIPVVDLCPLCNKVSETTLHALWDCKSFKHAQKQWIPQQHSN
ncbi:hypothetical protein Dsin_015941 [Dipteronia sinensis]|uniref:Reverse transcriptase domain-containing protein n=1 Tax=Dipteronia sinensis TaxID=43782 RepID=A0AAE0E5I3_9ROSI|nr:hypothetical protein Dsin_015941 [Dipteronia sinensis]